MSAADTTRVRLRVSPGGRRSEILGRHGEAWKVRVQARPERGRANADVLSLLSERLDLPMSRLALVSGETGRDKVVELRGLTAEEAATRLDAAAGA